MLTPDILQLAESGDSIATLDHLRRLASKSLYFFTKVILGYPDLTPELHQPVCHWIVDTEENRGRGLLIPRKFFKSTIVKGYVLRRLTTNTNMRILFVGENDLVGAKNLNDIKWHIQSNKLFQALYPHMIPSDYGAGWATSAITLPRSRTFDEPTIQTVGIGAKHTGFHYDLIIYDDPIGLAAAQSPAEMQRAIEWFKAAPGLLNSPESEEIIVGTRWKDGTGDLYGWIMDRLPYREQGKRKEGFVWYVRSAIENDKSIFPERYSLTDLEQIRKREGNYLFNANFMNQPSAREGADFLPEWIQTYRVADDRRAWVLSTKERIDLTSLVRISVYDPSSGGKTAEAENAIVVAGMDARKRIFVLDAWALNCGFGRAIEQWCLLNDKWHCWRNYYEAVGAHKEVDGIFKMRSTPCQLCGKSHQRLRPYPVRPPDRSKEDRIRAYAQPAFEEGRIFIREGMEKLRRQIETFPHSPMVDLFDALAYGISLLRPPLGGDPEERKKKAEEQTRKHEPRCFTSFEYGGYS